ncbi:MAG: nucleotide exchange factor GrpE [bacterium]
MARKKRIANRKIKLIGKSEKKMELLTSDANNLKQLDEEKQNLIKLLEQKDTELKEQRDSFMRKLAESENAKRLQKKETEHMIENSTFKLFKEILAVVDNFDRAIEHAVKTDDKEKIIDGIRMIDKQFHQVFEKLGVTQFESRGQKFDPSKHEAISVVSNTSLSDGEVVEEHQRGYMYGDKILRAAKVVVNKIDSEIKEEIND